MARSVEILKQAEGSVFLDEDGNQDKLILAPPLAESELAGVAATAGVELPNELKALLLYCRGFEGVLESVDFTGQLAFESKDIFPHGLPIAGDGYGNFWVIDLQQNSEDTAVFYACHDPPVIVYQADSLPTFVEQMIEHGKQPKRSFIDEVHERHAMNVWKANPNVLTWEQASAADDDMKAFASGLDATYLFVDLRNPHIGDGFSWGRFGADTVCKRLGTQRIFAYQQKKLSWIQKIFGV